MSVTICRHADLPEHLDEVTRWTVEQWPDPGITFSDRRSRLLDQAACPGNLVAVAEERPIGVIGFSRFQ